jgi:hypothetical protein
MSAAAEPGIAGRVRKRGPNSESGSNSKVRKIDNESALKLIKGNSLIFDIEADIYARLLIHNIMNDIFMYISTQVVSNCVSDFMLALLFHGDYVRLYILEYILRTFVEGAAGGAGAGAAAGADAAAGAGAGAGAGAAGGAGASASSSGATTSMPLIKAYFAAAWKKMGIMFLSQKRHLNELKKIFNKLDKQPASGAGIQRHPTEDVKGVATILRQIINRDAFFTEGVCYKNLTAFLQELFVTDSLHIFNRNIAYTDYFAKYDNAGKSFGGQPVPLNHKPDKIPRDFKHVFAIMLHINPIPAYIPGNPASTMHHAVGFLLHKGIWHYVDNENKGIGVPVTTDIVKNLYQNATDDAASLFTAPETLDITPFYRAIGTPIDESRFSKCYIHRCTMFYASDAAITEWNDLGESATDSMEDELIAAAELPSGTAAGTPVASIESSFEGDVNHSAAPAPLSAPTFSMQSILHAKPATLERIHSLAPTVDATLTEIRRQSSATKAAAAAADFEVKAEEAEEAKEAKEAEEAKEIAKTLRTLAENPDAAAAVSGAEDTGTAAAPGAGAGAGASGGRRRCRHRTHRKRNHAPKTRSKAKSKRKQTRHRRKN